MWDKNVKSLSCIFNLGIVAEIFSYTVWENWDHGTYKINIITDRKYTTHF